MKTAAAGILQLSQVPSVNNLSEIVFLRTHAGGAYTYKNSTGQYVNLCYKFEYINRWGVDMTEKRVSIYSFTMTNCSESDKEKTLKKVQSILEKRPDLCAKIENYLAIELKNKC